MDSIKKEDWCVIVFGNIHLKYLYSDMQIRKPFYVPYCTNKESRSYFISRIDPEHKKNVYLVTSEYNHVKSKYYHQTIVDLVEKYKQYPIVKLL